MIFPCLSLIVTGQFAILGTKQMSVYLLSTKRNISGHNCKNIVYSALLDCGLAKQTVYTFTLNFNTGTSGENLCEHQQEIIDDILQSDAFKTSVNRRLNGYIKQHAALLKICASIEETFSSFTLVKLFFNRLYIMMDIICILYVIT